MMGWIFHFVVFCEMCHVWRFAPGVWRFAPGVFGASRPVSSASRPSVWRFAPQILTLAPASVKTAFSQPGPPPYCDKASQQSVVFSLRVIFGDLEQEALGVKTPFTVL